ncbi:MAG TPA: AI-2E family transporter [Myxococcales bacterium]|nr:AI-2E family transporter [Myxococcales bacterium]
MKIPMQEKSVVRFEIAPGTIGLILAAIAGVWLLRELWVLGLLVVVALLFAGTVNPLLEWMESRGLKRTLSLILLFCASVLVASLLLFLTVPPLVEQLAEMVHGAPADREQLIALLSKQAFTLPLAHAVQNAGLEQTFARIESYLLGYSSQAVKGLGYFLTTFVLSFYLLTDGKRTQGVLYAIVPREYHMRLARILHNLETIVGGYMRGQLITSAAIAVFTFVLLVICKVPNALSLALFAGLTDVIPFVGGFLAAGPAVLSALPRGVPVAMVVLVSMSVYMEFESRILVPKVYGHVLRLSPTAVLLALIAGGTLLGVMGALLALPIAAGLQMILEELRVEMPGDDSDDRGARARNAKTEATYERMSAGSTAPEAGQIARNLAHEIRDADAADAARQGATK